MRLTFVERDAIRLLAEIMADYDNGHPILARYVRKTENVIAFAHLVNLDLVDVQEQSYFGIFKRKVIVPKESSS